MVVPHTEDDPPNYVNNLVAEVLEANNIHRVDPQTLARQDVRPPLPPKANRTPASDTLVQPHVNSPADLEQHNQEVAPGHAIQVSGAYHHVETNNSRRQHHAVSAISGTTPDEYLTFRIGATQERQVSGVFDI